MPVHFSPAEMSARRVQAVAAMRRQGLDALALFKQESMYYLCGYDTFGFSLFQCLVMTADGKLTLLTRTPDLRQAQYTSDLQDIRCWVDREGVNPQAELKAILEEHGLSGSTVGIELDSYGLKARAWDELRAQLNEFCRWRDASALVDELRAVKSEDELKFVRRAAELADDAWDAGLELLAPGAFEGDILAAMQGAVFKGGGDYAGNEFIIGSGAGALLCRYFTGRRHLSPNDQLTLEFAGAYRRYHAALMRTAVIGHASNEQRAMHAACEKALNACINALKPGTSMGEVFDEHARVFDAAGYREHRMNACGYGMGAVYNPLWVDPPMFYHGNPRLVSAGNVFFLHMILMNSNSGQAMTLGTSVVVGESGAERLSRLPLTLTNVTG